jgi:hypothetical protein
LSGVTSTVFAQKLCHHLNFGGFFYIFAALSDFEIYASGF